MEASLNMLKRRVGDVLLRYDAQNKVLLDRANQLEIENAKMKLQLCKK